MAAVVITPQAQEQFEALPKAVQAVDSNAADAGLPPLPPADRRGNRPAVAFARASIARSIAEERLAAGLSQQELARLAGVRQETVSRIESGKHSPTVRTVEKIDCALQTALKKVRKGRRQEG